MLLGLITRRAQVEEKDQIRISDQIRIIRAQQGISDTIQVIQVVSRSLIALVVVGVGSYALITGVPIPPEAWKLALVIVGALFGVDTIAKLKGHIDIKNISDK
jgi:hypothetical protein